MSAREVGNTLQLQYRGQCFGIATLEKSVCLLHKQRFVMITYLLCEIHKINCKYHCIAFITGTLL